MKKYYVARDYQGGEFGMHRLETLKGWRETAISWAESDESNELVRALKRYEIKNNDLIDYISEYWELDFKELKDINEYIDFELEYIPNDLGQKKEALDLMVSNEEITEKQKNEYLKKLDKGSNENE